MKDEEIPITWKHMYKRRLEKSLSDLSSLIDTLANFDIDIFLNFNPDKCLFRDHFTKPEGNKDKEEKDDDIQDFNEDAMLGKVFVKDEEKEKMRVKEKYYIGELQSKKKNQKEMSPEDVRIMFMMQGVLVDIFVKAVKIQNITKSSFIGSLVRFSENVNRHLLSEGGFFSFLITLVDDEESNLHFHFDTEEGTFKVTKFKNSLLDLINNTSIEYNKQYVIKDILDCDNREEATAAISCYKSMLKMAKLTGHNSFKYMRPENSVWVSHFIKIRNCNNFSDGFSPDIKNILFLSVHQMFTTKESLANLSGSLGDNSRQPLNRSPNRRISQNINTHNLIVGAEAMIKEIQNLKPPAKSYEDVYKQVAVFLNYFTNFTEFVQLVADRTTMRTFNHDLFSKMTEALFLI